MVELNSRSPNHKGGGVSRRKSMTDVPSRYEDDDSGRHKHYAPRSEYSPARLTPEKIGRSPPTSPHDFVLDGKSLDNHRRMSTRRPKEQRYGRRATHHVSSSRDKTEDGNRLTADSPIRSSAVSNASTAVGPRSTHDDHHSTPSTKSRLPLDLEAQSHRNRTRSHRNHKRTRTLVRSIQTAGSRACRWPSGSSCNASGCAPFRMRDGEDDDDDNEELDRSRRRKELKTENIARSKTMRFKMGLDMKAWEDLETTMCSTAVDVPALEALADAHCSDPFAAEDQRLSEITQLESQLDGMSVVMASLLLCLGTCWLTSGIAAFCTPAFWVGIGLMGILVVVLPVGVYGFWSLSESLLKSQLVVYPLTVVNTVSLVAAYVVVGFDYERDDRPSVALTAVILSAIGLSWVLHGVFAYLALMAGSLICQRNERLHIHLLLRHQHALLQLQNPGNPCFS